MAAWLVNASVTPYTRRMFASSGTTVAVIPTVIAVAAGLFGLVGAGRQSQPEPLRVRVKRRVRVARRR